MNFKDIVNQRQGGERAMNYAYFMYISLCDWTNTCRLNWTDFLSFLSVQLNREKTLFFLDFPYNWLYRSTNRLVSSWIV